MNCPKPTQDADLNLANQKKAMDKVGYGPENPNGEDEKFWEQKAADWNLPISEAKSRRCGNCRVYNQSSDTMDCITKGMGDSAADAVEKKEIGYCESLNFICSSKRTCDAWAPRKSEEKVAMLDAYFKKVDELLANIEAKDATAAGTYEIDMETKVRKVKDSAYWGRPVGTPITPGMKPEGPKSPLGRARAAAGGDSGGAKPKKKIRPAGKKPSKPAGGERSEVAGADKPEVAGSDKPDAPAGAAPKKRIRPKAKPSSEERGGDSDGPNTKVVDAKDFSVGKAAGELKKIKKDGRKDGTGSEVDPIDVGDDIELAHKLLSEGKHIRMKDEAAVSTLLEKLHDTVKDAREKGDKAPEYDLCKVSVPKTNLFCVESKGIPRVKMPQFKGTPVEGSFADTRKNDKGEGDVEPEFRELLKELGIETEMKTVKANELRASQDNLDGPKVVGMAQAMREGKIPDAPIFVTKDGYILDGHHRWAAKVAIDLDDGVAGDIDMPVEVIDAEIGYLIDLANGFTEIAGIKAKGLGAAAEGVKRLVINPDGTLCVPCMAQ